MPNLKKSSYVTKYGIEITKPHSKEMYVHNDNVAKTMKIAIANAWADQLIKFNGEDDWPTGTSDAIVLLQSYVCAVGYGDGYTIADVSKDFCNELDCMANWQLHEVYSYLCFKDMVPKIKFMMVGFEWQKCDYDGNENYDVFPHLQNC